MRKSDARSTGRPTVRWCRPSYSPCSSGRRRAKLVGVSAAAIAAFRELPSWLVSALCYAAYIVPVYLLHRRFAFRSDADHGRALPRYCGPQWAWTCHLFSWLAYGVIGMPTLLAAILVICLTSRNFLALRGYRDRLTNGKLALPSRPRSNSSVRDQYLVSATAAFVLSRQLARAIPSRGSALDIGCGDGQIAMALMRPARLAEGVDIVPRPRTLIPVSSTTASRCSFVDGADYAACRRRHHHDPYLPAGKAGCAPAWPQVIPSARSLHPALISDWLNLRMATDALHLPQPHRMAGRFLQIASPDRVDGRKLRPYLPPARWLFDRHLH